MPRCPKCGKEIDHLRDFSAIWQEYNLTVDKDGVMHYEFIDASLPVDIDDEYQCPECSEVLFNDEEEAVKFLKGETLAKGE